MYPKPKFKCFNNEGKNPARFVQNRNKWKNYFYKKEYEKGIDYYLSIANVKKESLKKFVLFKQEMMWLFVASSVGNLETLEKAREKIKNLEALDIYNKIVN